MKNIMIAGIGTDVGKTVVSAIVTTALDADYWKPIQCGNENGSDTCQMQQWLNPIYHTVHPARYSFQAPLSPHHAAKLENRIIDPALIKIPKTSRRLVIEGAGGVLVPLKSDFLTLDLFETWSCQWIIVSNHYIGSINHTLLTVEALQSRDLPIAGIIFNGIPNPESEEAILSQTKLPCIVRLTPQQHFDPSIIQGIAKEWKPKLINL